MALGPIPASSSSNSAHSAESLSPRRSQPEEYVEYDDIELGQVDESGGIGSLALSFDFEEWRKAKVAPFVRNADKVSWSHSGSQSVASSRHHTSRRANALRSQPANPENNSTSSRSACST